MPKLAAHFILALLAPLGALAEDFPPEAAFTGCCDASAAAAVDRERFIVADDEDNVLRLYHRAGGAALSQFDVSTFLGNAGKKKAKEADLEAAAPLGDLVFWITSHGRNSKGKEQPSRQRLFATIVHAEEGRVVIAPKGQPYSGLLDDLLADPRLKDFDLAGAATLAPKAAGGLNIEALAATPEGHLLVGFRNPLRDGKALLVPVLNPREVIQGQKARLGPHRVLDLDGLGLRSLEWCAGRYLLIAGAPGEGGAASRLYEWDGQGEPKEVAGVTLKGLNPEGVAFHDAEGTGTYFILSDDGTRPVEGQDCKDLKDPALKRFRGRIVKF